jgi:chitinase
LASEKNNLAGMKKSLSVIAPFIMLTITSCGTGPSEHDYMVVGYVAGYRNFDFSQIDATKLTHINYAFANVIDGEVDRKSVV